MSFFDSFKPLSIDKMIYTCDQKSGNEKLLVDQKVIPTVTEDQNRDEIGRFDNNIEVRTVGVYPIIDAKIVTLFPQGKTWDDQNPDQFTDFEFMADLGEGDGEKIHVVRVNENVWRYYTNGGVVKLLEILRRPSGNKITISDKFAIIYDPNGSPMHVGTFQYTARW